MFDCCRCIESVNFKKYYRNNLNNMSYMFNGFELLRKINSNFNTDNVTNMSGILLKCKLLTEINLSNFNTDNVLIWIIRSLDVNYQKKKSF